MYFVVAAQKDFALLTYRFSFSRVMLQAGPPSPLNRFAQPSPILLSAPFRAVLDHRHCSVFAGTDQDAALNPPGRNRETNISYLFRSSILLVASEVLLREPFGILLRLAGWLPQTLRAA